MNPRSGLLAVVFCLVGAAIVVPIMMVGIYRVGISQGEYAARLAPEHRNPRLARPAQSGTGPGETISIETPDDSAQRLQALIDKKNAQLAGQQAQLSQQQQQIKQLEADNDMLLSLLDDLSPPVERAAVDALVEDTGDAPPAAPQRTREELQADLKTVRQQLEQALADQQNLTAEMEALRNQGALDAAAMQLAAEQTINAERRLRAAASEALVASGEAAVPILILMLRDEQPAIRAWSAEVLGAMRTRAQEALGALSETANNDTDERVREASRRALRSIRD